MNFKSWSYLKKGILLSIATSLLLGVINTILNLLKSHPPFISFPDIILMSLLSSIIYLIIPGVIVGLFIGSIFDFIKKGKYLKKEASINNRGLTYYLVNSIFFVFFSALLVFLIDIEIILAAGLIASIILLLLYLSGFFLSRFSNRFFRRSFIVNYLILFILVFDLFALIIFPPSYDSMFSEMLVFLSLFPLGLLVVISIGLALTGLFRD